MRERTAQHEDASQGQRTYTDPCSSLFWRPTCLQKMYRDQREEYDETIRAFVRQQLDL